MKTLTSKWQYLVWLIFWMHPGVSRDNITQYLSLDFFMMYSIWILPLICMIGYNGIKMSGQYEEYRLSRKNDRNENLINLERTVDHHFWKSQGITTVIYWIITRMFDIKLPISDPAPSRLISILQIFTSLIVLDLYNYGVHRLLHSTWLYQYHKVHHQFITAIPIAVNWLTFVEMSLITMPILFVPIFFFQMHHFTILMWATVTVCRGYYEHSDYDLPCDIFQLIPFSNNVRLHNDHHKYPGAKGNYGAYFHWWDQLFGTLIAIE